MSFFGSKERTPPRIGPDESPIVTPSDSNTPPPRGDTLISGPVRITDNSQRVNPIGMSYWRNIGNHSGRDYLSVVLSISNELTIFIVDKNSLAVREMRPLGITHTGEGIYFSAHYHDRLFIPNGKELFWIDVNTRELLTIWSSSSNLWQCHSNYNENLHSATLKNDDYEEVGWGLSNGMQYPIKGEPDECQIDKSGRFLLIKENDYNRIITIETNEERIILNQQGALGHSDMGFEEMFGENDYSSKPGALDAINLNDLSSKLVYSTGIWNMGYVSYTNAPGRYCLVTTPAELILVNIYTGVGTKICDNLTQDQGYENRPKANLCPLGEFAAFTSYVSGRLDCYVVRIPEKLTIPPYAK